MEVTGMSIVAGFCVYLWKRPVMQYTDRDIGVSGVSPGVSAGMFSGEFSGVSAGCLRGVSWVCGGVSERGCFRRGRDNVV